MRMSAELQQMDGLFSRLALKKGVSRGTRKKRAPRGLLRKISAKTGQKVSPKTARSRQAFLTWFQKTNPAAYAKVMQRAGLHVMSAEANPATSPSLWDSIVEGAKQILPTIVQARAQKQIFDAQLKRAQQGLPPLQTSEIAPTVRIETGVTKSTTGDIKKMLLFGGLGVAALVGLLAYKKLK